MKISVAIHSMTDVHHVMHLIWIVDRECEDHHRHFGMRHTDDRRKYQEKGLERDACASNDKITTFEIDFLKC